MPTPPAEPAAASPPASDPVFQKETLDAKLDFRLRRDEKQKLEEDAALAGLSLGALVRRRYFGRPIVAQADIATIKELRRLGGLLKHVHNESGGAYSGDTFIALMELKAAITRLAKGPVDPRPAQELGRE